MIKNYLINLNLNKVQSSYLALENDDHIITFYPVAKNANSSLKLFILQHLGSDLSVRDFPTLPNYELEKKANENFKKTSWEIVNFLPNYQLFIPIANLHPENGKKVKKIAIYRDPFERFISCYKNRVLFHKDKNTIGMTIDNILDNLLKKIVNNNHFLPQTIFLGNDPDYFDFLFNTNELYLLENLINNFFKKELKFPKIQDGGKEFKVELNQEQKEKIKQIYQSDFNFINKIL